MRSCVCPRRGPRRGSPPFFPLVSGCSVDDAIPPGDAGSDAGPSSPLGNALPIGANVSLAEPRRPGGRGPADKYGRPHIYATNVDDAMRVEGYLVALDRTLQPRVLPRRVSEGSIAEILSDVSPTAIDLDITYRHIGLARTAVAQYAALTGAVKDAVDAPTPTA